MVMSGLPSILYFRGAIKQYFDEYDMGYRCNTRRFKWGPSNGQSCGFGRRSGAIHCCEGL